jgi:hypothetical protein
MTFYPYRILDPGSRGQKWNRIPDPQHWIEDSGAGPYLVLKRIRIREAQKNTDPRYPDPAPYPDPRDLYCGDEIPDIVVEELGAQEGLEVDLGNKQYT